MGPIGEGGGWWGGRGGLGFFGTPLQNFSEAHFRKLNIHLESLAQELSIGTLFEGIG